MSPTRKEAAKAAGIGESTLRTYLQNPEFVAAYREAVGEVLEGATRRAQNALTPALDVLQGIMEDSNEQSTARITASRSILEYSLKMTDALDVQQRVAELEKAVADIEQERK